MQFNTYIFILILLPVTVIAYYVVNKIRDNYGKVVLLFSSIIFYAYGDMDTLIVMCVSLAINFLFAKLLEGKHKWRRVSVFLPILVNVVLLLYFKYFNFGIMTVNQVFQKSFAFKHLIMPIGISFFTFQQIAYVVSVYKEEIDKVRLLDYLTYIMYFPKLLMGPLVEPADFLKELNDHTLKHINYDNLAAGIQIFSFGLFKKMIIADTFANAVNWGFSHVTWASSMDLLLVMLFYTFEIYFDFSGYSDMAVGSSLMLNITLPQNFNSPYRAESIRDFWKRWHISLTKFFTKYIYFPLGGSKKGKLLTYINTMIVFLVSGIWHGANYTFILWGILHGLLSVFDRITEKLQKKVFEPVRWMLTFGCINVLWLLFRSDSISQWKMILKKILHLSNTWASDDLLAIFNIPETTFLTDVLHLNSIVSEIRGFWMLVYIVAAMAICLIPENNYERMRRISVFSVIAAAVAFLWGFVCIGGESVFVYFNF